MYRRRLAGCREGVFALASVLNPCSPPSPTSIATILLLSLSMKPFLISSAALCGLALAGCGTPGAPQPPSLRLPKPVSDLQAIRKGDDVYLRWTVPTKTSDNATIRSGGFGDTRICRGFVTEQPDTCRDIAANIATKADSAGAQTAVDHITDRLGGNRDFLSYTVKVNNDNGRNAGPSNAVIVFVAPSLPAPAELKAQLNAKEIDLTWQGYELPSSANLKAQYFYRVKRSLKDPDSRRLVETTIAELPAVPGASSYSDHSFAWEKTYEYRVCGLTRVISGDGKTLAEFEGQDSPVATVAAHDIFPPPVPAGLQAVYSSVGSQRFVDLTWSTDLENDFAGYNVYRSEGNGAESKINADIVKTPAYRDNDVAPGKTYVYRVTAVDAHGNESARSEPANEKVPE